MKKIFSTLGVLSLFLLCHCGPGDSRALQQKWKVPEAVYTLSEDHLQSPDVATDTKVDGPTSGKSMEQLDENFGTLLDNSGDSLSQVQEVQIATPTPAPVVENHPPDWVPWRMAYFLTDFSISVKGILGHLLGTGTPTVTVIWGKSQSQNKPAPPADDQSAISVSADQSPEDLDKQITPVIDAVAAVRKIPNKELLKENVVRSARYFTALMDNVESNPQSSWWVSRVRMDFTVDATGNVTPTIAVGGEAKIRIEWHRIMNGAYQMSKQSLPVPYSNIQKNMKDFVTAMSADLEQMSDGQSTTNNAFKAYAFIVGIGITKTANIGIAKTTNSAIGEVYFNRDVPKPNNPYVPRTESPNSEFVNIIEDSPTLDHVAFAASNGIPAETTTADSGANSPHKSVLYKASRKLFQKGLKHALQMANHFTKRTNKTYFGNWRIYELRANFSISLTGSSALATVAGNGVTEIDLYNENF